MDIHPHTAALARIRPHNYDNIWGFSPCQVCLGTVERDEDGEIERHRYTDEQIREHKPDCEWVEAKRLSTGGT